MKKRLSFQERALLHSTLAYELIEAVNYIEGSEFKDLALANLWLRKVVKDVVRRLLQTK